MQFYIDHILLKSTILILHIAFISLSFSYFNLIKLLFCCLLQLHKTISTKREESITSRVRWNYLMIDLLFSFKYGYIHFRGRPVTRYNMRFTAFKSRYNKQAVNKHCSFQKFIEFFPSTNPIWVEHICPIGLS